MRLYGVLRVSRGLIQRGIELVGDDGSVFN